VKQLLACWGSYSGGHRARMEAVGDVCFSGASTIVCDCAASDKFVELAGDAAVDVWLCNRWIAVLGRRL